MESEYCACVEPQVWCDEDARGFLLLMCETCDKPMPESWYEPDGDAGYERMVDRAAGFAV